MQNRERLRNRLRQAQRERRGHDSARPTHEQRVTEPSTQFGESVADARLTHVHLLGHGRYSPLLHQPLKKQQQIEINFTQIHDAGIPGSLISVMMQIPPILL